MESCREEEEDWFFDAREEISSVSDCNSEVPEDYSCRLDEETVALDVWTKNPESVINRRRRFLETMGFSFRRSLTVGEDSGDGELSDAEELEEDIGTRLRASGSDEAFLSDRSSVSSSSNFIPETTKGSFEDDVDRVENMDDQMLFVRNESSHSSSLADGLSESGSSKSGSFRDFQNSPLGDRESDEARWFAGSRKKGRKGWLKKLGALTHILDRHSDQTPESSDRESVGSSLAGKRRITRVQPCKKQFKELSSLYLGQEFSAHEGSILNMKFSLDGQYLASAGEDRVVRIWKIIEDERADTFEIPEAESSYLYFGMNNLSQIEPLQLENEKIDKSKRWKKSSDSTCVVLPPRIFRIMEKPLHEFQGHKGEILDLSWSDNGFLLSSSVDETVRLWQVGSNACLKVFPHKNYVTCVAFNPVDDRFFISGSIDGKVRVWDVLRCRVVDYTDIREIVTAVCYRPDGKGALAGSMTGDIRFYNIIDNRLQLDNEIALHGKKKVPSKRITGFQFLPGDSDTVMVTSADSQIRVLSGVDVICKLKASSLLTTVSPMSGSFTSDGKHIVSATEDAGIHVWNYSLPNKKSSSSSSHKPKSSQSCESFTSDNASVAIPWSGIQTGKIFPSPLDDDDDGKKNSYCDFIGELDQKLPSFSSSDCFSLTRGFMVESLMKGSTTWPEEKLPEAGQMVSPTICRSKLKFLRNACQNVFGASPHMWGLVIVAATWDGRIRAYHNYGLPIRL